MREAAADLDFEEAARLRDEIKRLRATELAVMDDPTAKAVRASRERAAQRAASLAQQGPQARARRDGDRALPREPPSPPGRESAAKGGKRDAPRKPTLDEMGPGPDREAKPYRPGPRSTSGRAGMRGGWKPRGR